MRPITVVRGPRIVNRAAMIRILIALAAGLALTGCNDTLEQQVDSDQPMGSDDAAVMGQLGQEQRNTVGGMYDQGSLNEYEKEQMDAAIGSGK